MTLINVFGLVGLGSDDFDCEISADDTEVFEQFLLLGVDQDEVDERQTRGTSL